MMTILASIGIAALCFLACSWVALILSAFERLKRIEAVVDRMEARLNVDEEEDDDEAE